MFICYDPLGLALEGIAHNKINVGYSEVASGIIAVIKAVLSFEYNAIPATIGVTKLNPKFGPLLYVVLALIYSDIVVLMRIRPATAATDLALDKLVTQDLPKLDLAFVFTGQGAQ
ncbi:hypothetical protein PEBR_16997 [Penicillium brasilianum]|uniref:Beta-ketoacyl synthase C-terminal domain-containing protein n=1 Tax=Penicillium brasilianum TaxID=104259 RepID=A0A1S9RUN4_PENBI|nr:hypothetical protein PEBR_16997 [Penicillium brasilianum]